MKHLIIASTTYQCLSLAAAIDAGALPEGEKILVLANSSRVPELTERLQDVAGFDRIAARFDAVVDLAELIYPRRPPQWAPRTEELPMWEKLLRSHWKLGTGPVSVLVDSIQVNPGLALAGVFRDAPLGAHSDGLMAYGPTRKALPLHFAQRIERLVYIDLVPGLRPQLLREYGPELHSVPAGALRKVVSEAAAAAEPEVRWLREQVGERRSALILGQYLAHLGLLSSEDETALHVEMLRKAVSAQAEVCIFKPHPSAGPAAVQELQAEAAAAGIELIVAETPVLAEVLLEVLSPALVAGCFSTGLATAKFVFGIETVAVGTERMLEALTPYENSNRIPVTIIDAVLCRGVPAPALAGPEEAGRPDRQLQPLIEAVAYCMQSVNHPYLRDGAAEFLTAILGTESMRYFKRRRLTKLALPGALPGPARPPALRRFRRAGGRLTRRFLAVVSR
ncbi:alpha-2,8-polysialyltransferase family protein [Arthrobacter mangrovi]|uniref:Capsule polysaccharide biosynthesis protein n=1 Tax=Arthrobacter mangrovi TaxID=2966350 RepID=A0ABQ5MW88_9MICC|nr:alpha-2,8-polysialyltransferase family protein [Arthrobacter mangrovi]GLB68231.1 hypothetical protein AHIS1636_26730 [Arthrobacter mangrovi]